MATPTKTIAGTTMSASKKSPSLQLLIQEEETLFDAGLADGPYGRNGSDYRRMYDLYLLALNDALSIRSKAGALYTSDGECNDKVWNVYQKAQAQAERCLKSLNNIRNQDKMMDTILNDNVKELAQSVAIDLGSEVRRIIEGIDAGSSKEETTLALKRFLNKSVPEMFLKAAREALTSTKETYGLE